MPADAIIPIGNGSVLGGSGSGSDLPAFINAERPIALDGQTLHAAPRWKIIARRIMLGGTVVPHHNHVRLPTDTKLVFRDLRQLVEKLKEMLAFKIADAQNAFGCLRTDEDRPSAAHGMDTYDRVALVRKHVFKI